MEARRDKRLGVRSMTSVEYRESLDTFEIRTADAGARSDRGSP